MDNGAPSRVGGREEEQFVGISDSLAAMTQFKFDQLAPIQGDGGVLDDIAAAINLLAEELKKRAQDRDRVKGVLNAIRDAVVVISETGHITYLNKAAAHLLEHDGSGAPPGRLHEHLLLPESARESGEELLPAGDEPQPSIRRLLRREGRNPTPVIVSTAPLSGVGKTAPQGHVCILFGQSIAKEHRRWLASTSETHVPFSVKALIDEVLAFHHDNARDLGVTLELGDCSPLPPWVTGARSPIQNVLHTLTDAALQWTRKGTIRLTVNSITAPATSRIVLRFLIDNRGGQVDDSLRRRLFEADDEADSYRKEDPYPESISMRTAVILAESLGGKLGLHRGHDGEFAARLWIELPVVEL